ncbi:MAG: 4Fe-4S binding protein [Alphaproteobacteria bacterium]
MDRENAFAADPAVYARVFPAAESFGRMSGTPPAVTAYKAGAALGYVLFTHDVVKSVGFSGKPLDIAVGLDLSGRITGAELVEHQEPILAIGVSDTALKAFARQYRGIDVRTSPRIGGEKGEQGSLDAVSGATVSSLVINDAVLRAARAVARSRGIFGAAASALDLDKFTPADWPALLASGAVARLTLTNEVVDPALRKQGAAGYGPAGVVRDPKASFIDLYVALITPADIGRNILGARIYDRLAAETKAGDQIIMVGARGYYSFKGLAWRRTGVFDRLQIVQGTRTHRLRKDQHRRIRTPDAGGAPEMREVALFTMSAKSGFDATRPWRLELLVAGKGKEGTVYARFAVPYRVPAHLVRAQPGGAEGPRPLWHQAWFARIDRIVILAALLATLTLILVFQDVIVRHYRFFRILRTSFLAFVVVWLGWYAGAQLSVVNVLTFGQALVSGFHWQVFLVAPLIFILWSYVAVTLLFWGRGVLCGWLCPFGALHELLNQVARRLRVPQFRIPFRVHERLWPIKYVIFLGLFALSLGGIDNIQWGIEIEPFKTAVVLGFVRDWPFVLYAVALLAAGLFIERFFCRYLCPLGAALGIPARLRMFEWLKRKRQCGASCQTCADNCPVQAIHPEGQINPNECVYCLNCQIIYNDEFVCPPLMVRRTRRERHLRQGGEGGSGAGE